MLIAGSAAAAPAVAAHDYRHDRGASRQIDSQIRQLVDRIHRAEDRDAISNREEDRLIREARQIDRLHDRYRRHGLSNWEMRDLQGRIQHLRQALRFERLDDRRYGYNRW